MSPNIQERKCATKCARFIRIHTDMSKQCFVCMFPGAGIFIWNALASSTSLRGYFVLLDHFLPEAISGAYLYYWLRRSSALLKTPWKDMQKNYVSTMAVKWQGWLWLPCHLTEKLHIQFWFEWNTSPKIPEKSTWSCFNILIHQLRSTRLLHRWLLIATFQSKPLDLNILTDFVPHGSYVGSKWFKHVC